MKNTINTIKFLFWSCVVTLGLTYVISLFDKFSYPFKISLRVVFYAFHSLHHIYNTIPIIGGTDNRDTQYLLGQVYGIVHQLTIGIDTGNTHHFATVARLCDAIEYIFHIAHRCDTAR